MSSPDKSNKPSSTQGGARSNKNTPIDLLNVPQAGKNKNSTSNLAAPDPKLKTTKPPNVPAKPRVNNPNDSNNQTIVENSRLQSDNEANSLLEP
jgi:hypothetical protein